MSETKEVFVKVDPSKAEVQDFLKSVGASILEPSLVRVKKSPQEKKAQKQRYRKEYITRPHVMEKKAKDKEDPEIKARDLAYAQDPDTIARRNALCEERRNVPRKVKEIDPALWAQLCPLAAAPRVRKRKASTSATKEPAQKKKKLTCDQLFDAKEALRKEQSFQMNQPMTVVG